MTEAGKQARKHYRRAMKLKEGGAAWDREITKARELLKIALQQN